ncbi:TPA: MinD/ParA family protein [Candidatus Poribacteria bacterium]|nr:MinD/ParA family protein [Candidatus Poribacteria bacterium]HIN27681.1 MinD/ParA family protein [Candidatus Poribacteria bacterium]HIO45980.1 MinD/ParA family protein [Candidatus Poribacteria bacterium]
MKNNHAAELRRVAKTVSDKVARKDSISPILRTIAVTGGKGGVGKTNVATNLAIAMAQLGKRVGILDADLGLANVDVMLHVNPRYTLKHVVTGEKKIEDIIVKGPLGISVIAGSSGIKTMADLPVQIHKKLIGELHRLNNLIDILIIDTPAGIGNNVLSFVLAADEILAVTIPDPMAYTDAYALIKVISRWRQDAQINLLINMVRTAAQAREVAEILKTVVRKYNLPLGRISYAGYIPYDSKIKNSLLNRKQTPFMLANPDSLSVKCIQVIAKRMISSLAQHSVDKNFFSQFEQIREKGQGK